MDILIPKKLKNELKNIGLSRAGTNHAINFYQFYMRELTFAKDDSHKTNNYVYIPSETMRTLFTSKYFTEFVKILKKKRIISRRPFFNGANSNLFKSPMIPKENKCFEYKFNPKYLDFKDVSYCTVNKKLKLDSEANEEYHIQNLKNIVFDFNKMKEVIENYNAEDEINFPVVNPKIIYQIKFKNSGAYYCTGKKILEKIDDGMSFFEFRNQYYIGDSDRFIIEKNMQIKLSYTYSFNKLYNDEYYARRNSTNFRLDTNITNLSKRFFSDNIMIWNGEKLVEIDLRNCQPALLAYAIENIDFITKNIQDGFYLFPEVELGADFKIFKDYVETGMLYDNLASDAGVSRDKAKNGIFEILFSSQKFHSSNKKKIKSVFPSVISWVDEFKKLNGYKEFSIMLQKLESFLFLDYLLPEIQNKKHKVLTKHDCFLCKKSDEKEVREIVTKKFNKIGFRHKLSA